ANAGHEQRYERGGVKESHDVGTVRDGSGGSLCEFGCRADARAGAGQPRAVVAARRAVPWRQPATVRDDDSVEPDLRGRRSRYATGNHTTPSTARVKANTRCAARLNASSRDVGAYWLKKKIHAAWVVPRCATVTGSAATMKITGRNVSIWPNGMW